MHISQQDLQHYNDSDSERVRPRIHREDDFRNLNVIRFVKFVMTNITGSNISSYSVMKGPLGEVFKVPEDNRKELESLNK